MNLPICITCGVQYAEPDIVACPICEDERQYVRHDGQAWTTLPAMRAEGYRNEIRDGMSASFASHLKGSSVTDEIQGIRFLGDDHAIAISKAGILFAGEDEVPAGRYVYATWVLRRQDGRWLVVAYHNSPAEPK